MLYYQENVLKSIYDLYTFTTDYEINFKLLSDNDKNLIKLISSDISQIIIQVNFYHRTRYSIKLISVIDSKNTQLTKFHTQIEPIIDQLEFTNNIIDELSLNMIYIMNGIIKRDNI